MLGMKVFIGVVGAAGIIAICCWTQVAARIPAASASTDARASAPLPIGGCCAPLPVRSAADQAPSKENNVKVTLLDESLVPLIDHFNKNEGQLRFMALLSSTCPACVFGANAVHESIVKAYPDADISITLVWIDMLQGDGDESIKKIAATFTDPRITQFYDVKQLAGTAISKALLYENAGPAWDIYLFFGKDARWTDVPPKPADWMHQLSGGKRADPARFRVGKELARQLHKTTEIVLAESTGPDAARSRVASATLNVNGMTCGGCVNKVQTALMKVPGVKNASVSLKDKQADVSFEQPTLYALPDARWACGGPRRCAGLANGQTAVHRLCDP